MTKEFISPSRLVYGLALTALLLCLALPASAQRFEHFDAGGIGGGVSTGGPYLLQDTLGQASAGLANSANYSLQSGFWTTVALPPEAHSPMVEARADQSLELAVSELLAEAVDADSDTISLVGFDLVSVHGGTVTRTGDLMLYTPPPGFAGTDTFSYSIVDSGGDTARGVITIVVTPDGELRPVLLYTPAMNSNGSFGAFFLGVPAETYTVEFTDSLAPARWQKLTNIAVPASTSTKIVVQFTDFSPNVSTRFYRVVQPSY